MGHHDYLGAGQLVGERDAQGGGVFLRGSIRYGPGVSMVRAGEIELGERLADLAADLGGRVFHVFVGLSRASSMARRTDIVQRRMIEKATREAERPRHRRGNTDAARTDEEPRLLPARLLDIGVIMQDHEPHVIGRRAEPGRRRRGARSRRNRQGKHLAGGKRGVRRSLKSSGMPVEGELAAPLRARTSAPIGGIRPSSSARRFEAARARPLAVFRPLQEERT